MQKQNSELKKPEKSVRWIIAYVLLWIIFFLWVYIWIYGGFIFPVPDIQIMKLWIRITVIAFVFMFIRHIIMFRLKWEAREKWMKFFRWVWKGVKYLFIVILVLLVINLIYGKIRYSKLPEVDESMFLRTDHQTILPDDEDALIQLRNKDDDISLNRIDGEGVWSDLQRVYYVIRNENTLTHKKNPINWKEYQDECLLVYSWDEASCGTWVRNEDTLNRILNFEINIDNSISVQGEKYLTVNWENVSLMEYIAANEQQIKSDLEELDRLLSMDYYLPDNRLMYLPTYLQWYSRGSLVVMLYYIQQENWDMVEYVFDVNYKMVDLLNNIWWVVGYLISSNLQLGVDETINSTMQLLPEDLRLKLATKYSESKRDRESVKNNVVNWEYVLANEYIFNNEEMPFFLNLKIFPLNSDKDTKKLILYWCKLLYDEDIETLDNLAENLLKETWYSAYNIYWTIYAASMIPRVQGIYTRLDWSVFGKQALINNLKSGEYDMWFNEKRWNDSEYLYETYSLSSEEELN